MCTDYLTGNTFTATIFASLRGIKMSNHNDIVQVANIKRSLANGNMVAFVGAGMSVGAGLPGWYTLIKELSARVDYNLPPAQWTTGEALIDAAQYYINQEGLHSLIDFLKNRLDTTGMTPSLAHRALAKLPISLAFTANYDDFLEQAYRKVGKRIRLVVRDTSMTFSSREEGLVNIVKLYGDLNQPETIVLARQQYESYFLQRPQMIKLLETELARSDMLYLGWSHSDPHFNLIFGEMLNRFGQFMRSGYAVMFDVPEAQQLELERKHIYLMELPPGDNLTEQLAAWLEGLN
jgi:NAD-dependent SIR2 family protein deacetylase